MVAFKTLVFLNLTDFEKLTVELSAIASSLKVNEVFE